MIRYKPVHSSVFIGEIAMAASGEKVYETDFYEIRSYGTDSFMVVQKDSSGQPMEDCQFMVCFKFQRKGSCIIVPKKLAIDLDPGMEQNNIYIAPK